MKRKQPNFWSLTRSASGNEAELRINGAIVSDESAWFYEWFGDPYTTPGSMRAQVKELDGVALTLWIDSPGGDVDAAAAIYTALMERNGTTTGKIEARAYSAATLVAMACDEILISPMGTMMVHLPWTETDGNEYDLRRTADILAECRETMLNAYEIKTRKSREELLFLLEANDKQGTWMSAQKAIEMGFADGMLYGWESEQAQKAIVNRAQAIYAMERPKPAESADWKKDAKAMLEIEQLRI